jgi:hypothetical protein
MSDIEYVGGGVRGLSEAEVKMIARQAGRAAVEEAFPKMLLQLGVDITDHESVIELQADRQWTRRTRQSAEETRGMIKKAGIGAAVTLVVTIFIVGLRAWFKQQGGDIP